MRTIPTIDTHPRALPMKLEDDQRRSLAQMVQSPGYPLLLKIMETHCINQDIKLRQVPVCEPEAVIAEHRVDNAMWEFFANVQEQVRREVDMLTAPQPSETPEMDDEQEIINRVLDPVMPLGQDPEEV